MQSNREPIESNVESNPVFIPKRMQNQTKNSFVANGYHNQFKHKEISVNGSALPNRFKTKPIKSLKRQSIHTIPVKAEIHQQIEAEAELRAADRQTISANGLTAHRLSADTALSGANNEKSKTMTAIKGILKSKPSSKRAVGGVSGVSDGHASDATEVSASVSATVSSDSDRLQCRQSDHKTHNPSRDLTKKFRSTPSERRTSCSVQFDIHDIKESTRVELNANPVSSVDLCASSGVGLLCSEASPPTEIVLSIRCHRFKTCLKISFALNSLINAKIESNSCQSSDE